MATIGEFIKLTMVYTCTNSSEANNVFHFTLLDNDIDDDDLVDDLADWAENSWGAQWKVLGSAAATLDSISVDAVSALGVIERNLGLADISLSGLASGGNPASAVSGYLLAQTIEPKQRGSKYVPFIGEDVLESGLFTTAGQTALSLLLIQYLASQTLTGDARIKPGLISRTRFGYISFIPQGLINDVPAYQRRRKPFVGS